MKARRALFMTLVLVACSAPPPGEPGRQQRPARSGMPEPSAEMLRVAADEFITFRDAYLDWYYESHPVRATELGLHAYDAQLTPMDRMSVQGRIEALLDWDAQLRQVPFPLLEADNRFDYAILEFALRAELLDLEEIRRWAADPRVYTGTIASGIGSLAEREFAPLAERLESMRARMVAAPALLEAARENLATPPRLWTELGIADARGLLEYLREGLPAMLAAQGADDGGPAGFEEARLALVDALAEHVRWLEGELLPRSNGDFRLGRYLFLRKLLYEEHIDLSVEALDRLNEEAIAEYQARVERVAAEIDSTRTPRAIMDSVVRLHPAPEELVPAARAMVESARAWVLASDVVTVPTTDVPTVREAPPYARGGFAAMDAPGPFEDAGLEAYYTLTNVLPEWTESQKEEYLTYFNHAGLLGVTLHETFPGHFVQLGVLRRVESDVRKTFTPRSLVEGWAHYAEEMALDEGFGDGDPVLRLGQLRRALQRHARWYAGLHLHALGADMDEVVGRFMEIAYFDEFPARREVVRATYDPTYLYYALGRMQIMDLRDDYREYLEKDDREFSLRAFHDALLEMALPLPLAREALMPSERQRPRQIYRR